MGSGRVAVTTVVIVSPMASVPPVCKQRIGTVVQAKVAPPVPATVCEIVIPVSLPKDGPRWPTTTPVAPCGPSLRTTLVKVTEFSAAETFLSPPAGVVVTTLTTRRSALSVPVASGDERVAQSLVGLGSSAAGGLGVAPEPVGTELPVQAVLVAVPAPLAVELMVSVGSEPKTGRPSTLVWSQMTVEPSSEQVQPEPEKPV